MSRVENHGEGRAKSGAEAAPRRRLLRPPSKKAEGPARPDSQEILATPAEVGRSRHPDTLARLAGAPAAS